MERMRLKTADQVLLAALMVLLAAFVFRYGLRDAPAALLVTIAFALGGWALRGVSGSGAIAGWIVAFVVYAAGGWRMFLVLLGVFVLTLAATYAGRRRKANLGIEEHQGGRTAAQVGANLIVTVAALVFLPQGYAVAVALGTLCEAAADTASSEIGKAFGQKTYRATDLLPVPSGSNGGMSFIGTFAGICASAAVASIGLLLLPSRFVLAAFWAGIFGMMVDSLLGASLENDGYLENNGVNLLGTASAAAVAWLLCQA